MALKLLIKNIANSYSCGDAIHIYKDGETPGKYESKTEFIASGLSANDWPRQFVIVNVVDANKGEYDYLLENHTDDTRKYYITPQGKDSPFYDELLLNAEISVTKAMINPLIIGRI